MEDGLNIETDELNIEMDEEDDSDGAKLDEELDVAIDEGGDSDGSEFSDESDDSSGSLFSSAESGSISSADGSFTLQTDVVEYEEVSDPFADYCPGPDVSELEDKLVEKYFELSQEKLRAWDLNPNDNKLREEYFSTVHDLMLLPAFVRMQRNPYTFDWNGARRAEDRLSFDTLSQAFYVTHLQLSKLAHNCVPHYLQMLTLTPSKVELWYELGEKAVAVGDWKNAEFAYRKFVQFKGDQTKAMQNIVLLHFVSGDFLRTISALKELFQQQPNNTVGHIISNELQQMNGPWADHVDQIMKQSGIMTPRIQLGQERIDWILNKINTFREKRGPKCTSCTYEGKLLAQSIHYMVLEKQDELFYNFGNRLLQLYKDFVKEPNAFVFIKFPMRENDKILADLAQKPVIEVSKSVDESDDEIQILDVVESATKNKPHSTRQTMAGSHPTIAHFKIADFLVQFSNLNRFEKWKKLYGWKGITSIFDQLLAFVVDNCNAVNFKHHRDDPKVFAKLYQQWCKLLEHRCNRFHSPNLEAIHMYACDIGCEHASQKIDKLVYEILESVNEQMPAVSSTLTPIELNMSIDVEAERQQHKDTLGFDSMLRVFERLKQKRLDAGELEPMEVSSVSQNPETIYDFPFLLSLYLDNKSLEDFEVPDHLVRMQLNPPIDLFATPSTLSLEKYALLIYYHTKEAKAHRCLKREQTLANISKLKEYNHLLAIFKIANMHLSNCEDFRMSIKSPKALEKIPEIQRLLAEIKLDFFKLEKHARRLTELLKGFKRDMYDNYTVQFKQTEDKSEIDKEILEKLQNYIDLDGDTRELLQRRVTVYEVSKDLNDTAQMQDTLLVILNVLLENSEERENFLLDQLNYALNEINLHLTNSASFTWSDFDAILKELVGKSYYRTCVHLWMTHYKVACKLDPTTSEEFISLYNLTEATDQQRLPTESLAILRKAHTVLGEEKSCMKDEGKFLRLYLDELLSTINSEPVQEALNDSEVYDEDIYRSLNKEICQTINCLYKLELPARFVKVHEHSEPPPKFLQLKWDLCEQILPFFMPDTLPTISEKDTLSSELIELLQKFQPLVEEPLTSELKEKFERFTEVNRDFRPLCQFDPDSGKVEMSSMHNGVDLSNWPFTSDLSLSRRKLSAQIFYLLTFREFKLSLKGGDVSGSKIQSLAQDALLFGSDALNVDQLATLWMIIAVKMNYILEKPALELFKQMGYLFFPSYMAILMVKTLAETHLDLGTAFYRTITYFKRYLAIQSNTELRPEIEAAVYDLLPKSSAHLQLAFMFRNDNVEIGWTSKYYLGKIAEKLNLPLLKVMEHYQTCAQLMEDNFDFLKRVSKSDQEDFEPLELYYTIHSFLNKRRTRALNDQDLYEMRKIVRCLELFAEKHISRKSDVKTRNFSIDLQNEFNEVEKSTTEELSEIPSSDLLSSPSSLQKSNLVRKYNSEAEQLCSHAFEKIVSLFPHYKSAYRLAKHLSNYNQHKEAADLLFQHLFPVKGEINENQHMFKGFIVIENPSFYFSGTLDYHMRRIIFLLCDCLEKTLDIKRISYLLCNLLRAYRKSKLICTVDNLFAMIERAKNVFGQLLTSALTSGQPFNSAENPVYNSRLIIYEIDKQLRGSQFDFAERYHQIVQFLQQQMLVPNVQTTS